MSANITTLPSKVNHLKKRVHVQKPGPLSVKNSCSRSKNKRNVRKTLHAVDFSSPPFSIFSRNLLLVVPAELYAGRVSRQCRWPVHRRNRPPCAKGCRLPRRLLLKNTGRLPQKTSLRHGKHGLRLSSSGLLSRNDQMAFETFPMLFCTENFKRWVWSAPLASNTPSPTSPRPHAEGPAAHRG